MSVEQPVDPVAIDVSRIVQRTVASLYSHLVTRPTGRAVRLAIESQVLEAGRRALSLVDLSEVRVLDFSCADEVVAKLLQRFSERSPPPEAFFVFRGVGDAHRAPIEAALRRQSLAAVAETDRGRFELLGARSDRDLRVWTTVERLGRLDRSRALEIFDASEERATLETLVARRLVLQLPERDEYRALSTLTPGE